MPQEALTIGDWLLEPRLNRLSRDGRAETLEPLAAEVLAYLAAHAGEVVSAEKLTETLWPRRFVGDSPVYRIMADLRRILGDDARAPRYIETIRKRGYRLIADVAPVGDTVSPGNAPPPAAATTAELPSAGGKPRFGFIGLGLAAALVIAAAWYAVGRGPQPDADAAGSIGEPRGAPRRIAVLPFTDMSAGRDNEHIGDGIAEVLIHRLAQVPQIAVIARNSSFTFKDRSTDVREIGRALDADAVLEGSVQRSNGQLRIAAQLIDAESGLHYWSKLFDRDETDIFAIQDEIALAVITEIDGTSAPASLRRSTPPDVSFDSYDLYLLGRARLAEERYEQARELFATAAEQAPSFALAHAGLAEAVLLQTRPVYLGQQPMPAALDRAREALDRALMLDPELTEAQAAHVLLADLEHDWAAADDWFETIVASTPGYARAYIYYADAAVNHALATSDPANLARAESALRQARSLDPLNTGVGLRLADALMMSNSFDEARTVARDVYGRARTPAEATSALETLGEIADLTGRGDEAIAFLRIAYAHAGDGQARIAENLASYQMILGDTEQARAWFARGVDAPDLGGYIERGVVELVSGDLGALSSIERSMRPPDTPPGLSADDAEFVRAVLLHFAGDCDGLVELAETTAATSVRAGQPFDDLHVANCYIERGDTSSAAPYVATAQDFVERRIDRLNIAGGGERYLAACLWSIQRDRDEALRWLESAYAAGMRRVELVARDPTFFWLHGDREFEALVARIRAEEARMRGNVAQAERSGNWFALAGIEPKPWMTVN